MKLLVTGGMGFIGSNFIRHIYQKYPNYTIINYDALTYAGNPENLADIEVLESAKTKGRRYHFVHGDITDGALLRAVFETHQPDTIINFAAESHVDRSLVDSGEFIRSNIVGVQILLQLAQEYGLKFMQISTDEVYGDVVEGFSTEESPMRPSNPYAASKAGADLLVQSYIRSHGISGLIVRGSNNFGPYQYPEKLIPLAVTNILGGDTIPVHGNGKHIRTWLHTDDFARGIDLVLHEAKDGSIYNVAGHEESNLGVLHRLLELMEVSPKDALKHVGDRPGADLRYAPHAGKLERELGWKPERHLHEALPEIIDWYRDNPQWWKKVKAKKEFSDHYAKQREAKYY